MLTGNWLRGERELSDIQIIQFMKVILRSFLKSRNDKQPQATWHGNFN